MIFILVTTSVAWRRERAKPLLKTLAISTLALVIGVALLGAVTVTLDLPKEITTTHLALGLLVFALLVTLTVKSANLQPVDAQTSQRLFTGILVAMVFIYGQSVLGAYVRHSNAGLACPDLPLCYGQLMPNLAIEQVAVHWLHRVLAILTAVLVLATAARAWNEGYKLMGILAAGLVIGQILLGALTVWTRLQPLVAMFHLAGALGLLALFVGLAVRTWPQPQTKTAISTQGARSR